MQMRTRQTITLALCIMIGGVAFGALAGIEVSNLSHKVLSGPDDDGDLAISVKVTVKNGSQNDQQVEVWVQGIDKEDYEVFDVQLKGTVKANQSRVLTDTQYLSEKVYKSIVKWQIEE